MQKISIVVSKCWTHYREQILYIIFGALTTAINLFVYLLLRWVSIPLAAADVIAWILAVAFAYITNRNYVFHSTTHGFRACFTETISFLLARLISLGLELSFLFTTVEWLNLWELGMKTISSIIVIIANYIFSKVFVFRKN